MRFKAYLRYVAIGSFFATVEEFLTIVVLRNDVGAYVFTLLILFPIFLTFVWFSSRLINWISPREPVRELAHFFLYGGIGLLMEWFLMGLAPWSNPAAHPVLMLIFQLGMFSFWATVAFTPRLFAGKQELNRQTRKALLRFYVPYFLVVYFMAFTVSSQAKFLTIIGLVLFGYLFLNVYYLRYFSRAFAQAGNHDDGNVSISPLPGMLDGAGK